MKFRFWFAVTAIAALFLLNACGGDDDGNGSVTPTADTPTPAATEAPSLPEDTPAAETGGGAFETFSAFAGGWVGEWNNTTFGSTGEITAAGSLDEGGTGGGLLDIGGMVFGAVDPDTDDFTATYDDDVLTIEKLGDDVFGDVTITITLDGQLTMEATNVPDESIESVTGEGTITADQVDVTYTVTFTDGTTAEGTTKLTR